MDMFNKLKAKLAEEMDSETETVGGVTAGNGTQNGQAAAAAGIANGKSAEALTQEVQDLKEHINKNYYIYIRRLEKRKERIKELEEYAKLVLKDNETLTDQMKNYKGKKFVQCQSAAKKTASYTKFLKYSRLNYTYLSYNACPCKLMGEK